MSIGRLLKENQPDSYKKLNKIRNDNKEKLINNIDIETTINNATDLIDFQKCVKVTGKYSHVVYGKDNIDLKVLRVFASKSILDSAIMKVKPDGKLEKISYTPDRAFIDNGNIIGKKVPDYLDRNWYINLAKERLDSFIPEDTFTLFDYLDIL